MRVIAVSQRVEMHTERNEVRDALDQRLNAFLLAAGYLPIPVPNSLISESLDYKLLSEWLSRVAPEALVLSGGNNIGSFTHRDLTEKAMLDHAKPLRLPALGICRGMQMMGLWAGGRLKPVAGHVRTRHQLSGELGAEVNSYHDFSLDDCPPGFQVLARSEDGEIEAIRHSSLAFEGWMWHPEREAKFSAKDLKRLTDLFGK
jgi:gamma-glutamyl-gamma-aminobutyrate hydrolase PuuD